MVVLGRGRKITILIKITTPSHLLLPELNFATPFTLQHIFTSPMSSVTCNKKFTTPPYYQYYQFYRDCSCNFTIFFQSPLIRDWLVYETYPSRTNQRSCCIPNPCISCPQFCSKISSHLKGRAWRSQPPEKEFGDKKRGDAMLLVRFYQCDQRFSCQTQTLSRPS